MQSLKEETKDVVEAAMQPGDPTAPRETTKPEDVAAFYFVKGMEVFRGRVKQLSRKAAIRVMTALMQAPFGEEAILSSDEERLLFGIGMEIMDAKLMMTTAFIEKHPEQIVALKEHFNNLAKNLNKENE